MRRALGDLALELDEALELLRVARLGDGTHAHALEHFALLLCIFVCLKYIYILASSWPNTIVGEKAPHRPEEHCIADDLDHSKLPVIADEILTAELHGE